MLKKRIAGYVLAYLLFPFFDTVQAAPPDKNVLVTKDGVVIYPDVNFSGNIRAVRLQVVSDKIIRVIASPSKGVAERESLITVYPAPTSKNWTMAEKDGKVILRTPAVTATVLIATGAVSFADKDGNPILKEKQYGGRMLSPAVFEGQNSYGISQTYRYAHQQDIQNSMGIAVHGKRLQFGNEGRSGGHVQRKTDSC